MLTHKRRKMTSESVIPISTTLMTIPCPSCKAVATSAGNDVTDNEDVQVLKSILDDGNYTISADDRCTLQSIIAALSISSDTDTDLYVPLKYIYIFVYVMYKPITARMKILLHWILMYVPRPVLSLRAAVTVAAVSHKRKMTVSLNSK